MDEARISRWFYVPLVLVPLQLWFKDASVAVLALLFVSSLVWLRQDLASFLKQKSLIPWTLFAVWGLVALIWTPAPSLASWAKPLFAVFMSAGLCWAAARVSPPTAHAMISSVFAAIAALFVLLVIERITGGALIQLYRTETPAPLLFNVMRGGLVLLACASFPLAVWLSLRGTSRLAPVALLLAVFALSLTYRMDAVPVALICGGVAFGLIYVRPQLGASFVVMATGLIMLAWPMVFMAALNQGLHEWVANEIHPNWGYRIAIWGRVGELMMANPLIGYGFNAAREVGQTANLIPAADGNTTFLHPHNGFLQLWLELGLIGIVLFAASLAAGVRAALTHAPGRSLQACFAATWTTIVVIWLLSYGVWQSWWIAVIGLTAALFVLLTQAGRHAGQSKA